MEEKKRPDIEIEFSVEVIEKPDPPKVAVRKRRVRLACRALCAVWVIALLVSVFAMFNYMAELWLMSFFTACTFIVLHVIVHSLFKDDDGIDFGGPWWYGAC